MTNKPTNGIVPGSPDDYILDTYANIPREEPSYLWEPYFPSSAIAVIAGYPGGGKSSIALDIAARAARGDALPDGSHVTEKITVAYWSYIWERRTIAVNPFFDTQSGYFPPKLTVLIGSFFTRLLAYTNNFPELLVGWGTYPFLSTYCLAQKTRVSRLL